MRTLSRFVVLALGLALLSGCSPKSAAHHESPETSLQDIKRKGRFVVGLDDSFPPMGFRDDSGKIVGFDIDLATEAARRVGVAVEFKPVDWDGVVMSLDKGDIDVIWNGLTITEERKEKIAFSKPYLQNRQIVVVQDGSKIGDKAGLKGKVVGIQLGSSSEEALSRDAATSASLKGIRKYPNNVEALLDLASGRIDAVVVDEVVGRYYIAKKPGLYRVLAEDFGAESYGVGFRMKDASFRAAIDGVLEAMKTDGSADAISERWFGAKIVTK
jgi:polar amino acid transport system substrate-binding protein